MKPLLATCLLVSACAFAEAPCPRAVTIHAVSTTHENSCPGVKLKKPQPSDCWLDGSIDPDECSTRQSYICGNGITFVMEFNTETMRGFQVVRDEASGCETRYELEAL